jgi:hypothetical protein
MATNYKVLAQLNPSANTASTLYTCGTANGAVISTLVVCNQAVTTTFRVAVRPAGATLAAQHYIAFDTGVNTTDTIFLTIGTTLANTDVITVYANTANVSFSLFGSEIT